MPSGKRAIWLGYKVESLGMSRLIKWVLVLAAIAGGLVLLAGQATEKPLVRQEKPVSPDALGK